MHAVLKRAGSLQINHTSCLLRSITTASTTFNVTMAQTANRGAFILFEGVDRSGKSTQARKLVEALKQRGVDVQQWNFPDRHNTVTGQAINEYLAGKKELDDRAIHLLFSANRWEQRQALLAALESGTTLVVDRYAYSGVAYSAAKGADLPVDWCKAPDVGLPAPDLVIYLSVSNAVAAERAGFGEERYEKTEFQDKVRAAFEQLREPHWVVEDASQPIEQIHHKVLAEALDAIKRCQECEPIRQLWDQQPYMLQGPQQQHKRAAGAAAEVSISSSQKHIKQQALQQPEQQQPLQERRGQAF